MISRTLKNKKKFSKYLKISIIVLLVITISLITYKIYFNNKSSKQLFQSIKKQDELCNLDLFIYLPLLKFYHIKIHF